MGVEPIYTVLQTATWPFSHRVDGQIISTFSYNSGVFIRKALPLIMIFAGLGILVGFVAINWYKSRNPTAGLKVDTNPPSQVFVDNVQVGISPIEKFFRPSEITIKLIPNSTSSALSTYQTKARLTAQTYTVIKRDFGASDAQSAGEIISLQPQSGRGASLSVVTSGPDSASVVIDGQPQGFTPLALASLPVGDHQLVVSAPGYLSRTIGARALAGYKLVINAKLASLPVEVTPTPLISTISGTPSVTPKTTIKPTPTKTVSATPAPGLPLPYVKILSTPTGFLRVRSGPGAGSAEIGKVNPGETYPFLSSKSGWFEIQVHLDASTSGWISSQYAQKFE
jgi:hypothetical protein